MTARPSRGKTGGAKRCSGAAEVGAKLQSAPGFAPSSIRRPLASITGTAPAARGRRREAAEEERENDPRGRSFMAGMIPLGAPA